MDGLKKHECPNLKGRVEFRDDFKKWYYTSEEGRWSIDVVKCPICNIFLIGGNDEEPLA